MPTSNPRHLQQTVELVHGVPSRTPPENPSTVLFVNELVGRAVILPEEWDELDPVARAKLYALDNQLAVLDQLVALHLLTPFQADMVRDGAVGNLILGQYRVLALLGRGGMGVVYRAEHVPLRRDVAIKVFVNTADSDSQMVRRFQAEARAAARLHHPNLVACFDAGRSLPPNPTGLVRDYYVMELVNGQDLDALVAQRGPLPVARACDLFRQAAEGLAEAHRHGLIHRDIKPQNIIVTPDWQAKVLDFGLALHPYRRMTEPGTVLGTVGFMAPEQARDPHAVDARADLFSLGASMYWTLTGQNPFPSTGSLLHDFQARLSAPPPLVQQIRPELPEELCTLVNRMLSTDPDARPPSARVLAITLAGLARWVPRPAERVPATALQKPTVAIVEDDAPLRNLLRMYLGDEYAVTETGDGNGLLELLQRQRFDLIIMDVNLPGASGDSLVESIRGGDADPQRPMILLISGVIPTESLGGLLSTGADDFLAKPFSRAEFRSRVRALLRRRASEAAPGAAGVAVPATDVIPRPAPRVVPAPPDSGSVPVGVRVLSSLLSEMLRETLTFSAAYGDRLGRYVRALAQTAPDTGEYTRLKDKRFLDLVAVLAPFHDIGMLGVPHTIIHKPGLLDGHETTVIETHPVMGAEWLVAAGAKCPAEQPALSLAADVVRSHHEHWDGTGYPDGLAGDRIPLAARVVALATVYDALRSRRPYRPALSHARVLRLITTESPGYFDPVILAALETAAPKLEHIFRSSNE